MFVLELRVLPVLRRSPEGSGVPMDFADVERAREGQRWKEELRDINSNLCSCDIVCTHCKALGFDDQQVW